MSDELIEKEIQAFQIEGVDEGQGCGELILIVDEGIY